jgi:hypothetical protein
MIHIDLSGVKTFWAKEMFFRILDQLINQAGVYKRRGTSGDEQGDVVHIGETMNLYVDYTGIQIWVLPKPRIDG